MLNYKELSLKFTERLNQFDSDSIQSWIEFDKKRMEEKSFICGEDVNFLNQTSENQKIQDNDKESYSYIIIEGEISFSMAA